LDKRVVIVDTSNEIAGDGDIPHPGIGTARRMQVPTPAQQHAVMIEAVENHMPEVIVIDEIGTELEALAARTIAERGVQLVGTAHGNDLENLVINPTLSDLIGGIQSVTLGDEEARRRRTQKSILERKAPPTFDVVVEIQSWQRVSIHEDVSETVDAVLRGYRIQPVTRELDELGEAREVRTAHREPTGGLDARTRPRGGNGRGERYERPDRADRYERGQPEEPPYWEERTEQGLLGQGSAGTAALAPGATRRIYPFGISRSRLQQAIRETRVGAAVVDHLDDADACMTLRSYYRRKPQTLRDAEARGVPIYVLKNNTIAQMEQSLLSMRDTPGMDPIKSALQEAEDAATGVLNSERAIELGPQNSYVRRLQHQVAQRYNLASRSRGREPFRRVRIYPGEVDDDYS
jgi:hypothetical protein